ncbi:MAG: 4a-hydroxytetrahydrobiopterin dehydratase [bacterium TMED80]|nr:MAG: 4a-hydroxytetrahydrobiopterin dehydratase [bacterium TMED80]RZP24172.1 MAG: 4a-hydroxytetrahydrobiopterin dehydratase [bacterium]|tara:strand:- start:871 stop:1155 length:285 start_codon:yes stop_codon:yes gene_type:complete
MSELLSDKDINSELGKLNDWSYDGVKISKEISFKTYMDSIDMINLIAKEAERANHHPDMKVGYCVIVVDFTSHDLGGVTKGCIQMAKYIDTKTN